MLVDRESGVWTTAQVETLAAAPASEILDALEARNDDGYAQSLNPYELRPLIAALRRSVGEEFLERLTRELNRTRQNGDLIAHEDVVAATARAQTTVAATGGESDG